MEGLSHGLESSEQLKPDFYELAIGRCLTDEEIEARYNIFTVADIERVLFEIIEHFPEIETNGGIAPTPWNDLLAVIIDPRGNLLFLRQPRPGEP
jgi:hypothetical protein